MDIALGAIRRSTFARLKSEELIPHDRTSLDAAMTHALPENDKLGADSEALGIGGSKAVWHPLDGAALALSLACCAVAICVVEIDTLAWRLGTKQQLVVVGLMISIMSLCLGYVAPLICMQWEVRHGQTTLQNLDALLKKTAFGPQMDFQWRAILLFFTLLPLGLSLAYKQFFNDGTSTRHSSLDDLQFGMYPPPAMNSTTGTALMYNVSLPFLQTTWSNPPLPIFPAAFGFNTLVLNETATAMLDAPTPSFVTKVQSDLVLGETRNVTAQVYGLLSAYNVSVDAHRLETNESEFWSYYLDQGSVVSADTLQGWSIGRLGNWHSHNNRDVSWLFIAVYPTPTGDANLTTFIPYAHMYSFTRVPCKGTWSITIGGVHLVDGTCYSNSTPAPHDPDYTDVYQYILTNNQLTLSQGYTDILHECLGRLSAGRNATDTHWGETTFTTLAAGMLWSRIATIDGPGFPISGLKYQVPDVGGQDIPHEVVNATAEEAGLRYRRSVAVTSSRLTLRKGWALFLICAIQPVLLFALLVVGRVLYGTPLDRRFGLVALLAGVDGTGSNGLLRGAAFSGSTKTSVPLSVELHDAGLQRARVRYSVGTDLSPRGNLIKQGWLYS